MTLSTPTPTTTIQPPSTTPKGPSSDDDYPFYPTWMTKEEFNDMLKKSIHSAYCEPLISIEDIISEFVEDKYASRI